MNQQFNRRSFKTELPLPLPPGNLFTRRLACKVLAQFSHRTPEEIADERWPSDRLLAASYSLQLKAASAPAMTSVAGWAQEIAERKVAEMVSTLAAASAAVEVMRDGLLLMWNNYGSISVPAFVADASHSGFVQEGQPIPVRQFLDSAQTLFPYKAASISALTREMLESSNAEAFITDVLTKSTALAIDLQFFSLNAASVAAPAGIRNGISALTASVSTDPFGAVFEDVNTIVGAVAPVGGRGPFYIVGSAAHMSSMKGRFDFEGTGDSPMIPVITSGVGNDLLCVAAQAIAAAVDPDPDIEVASGGVLVMDTAPGAAGTTGTGEKSLFQTDSYAIKCRWPVSWVLRDPRGVSWLTPAWK